MNKSGIYKIISPNGRIYIGQAVNIHKRWKEYNLCNNNLHKQPKLYNSFQKYGVENHIFEIIEECSLEQLNEREIYWGEYYDVLGEKGLNLKLGNQKGKMSEEVKQRISISLTGKNKLTSKKGEEHASFGIPKTKKHKDNIKKGKEFISPDTLDRMSKSLKGKKKGKKSIGSGRKPGFKTSEETKLKQRLAKLNKPSNRIKNKQHES